MSRQQRLGLVALAIAVAVAAFLIARPGDDDEPADQGAVTVPAQTETQAGGRTEPAEAQPAETQAEPEPPEATRIEVEDGQPVDGVEEIEVSRGDTVRLTVSSDTPQQIHVHGYDIIRDAGPEAPARFRFEADIEGVFEVELEGPHTQIAELRVEP